MVFATNYGRQTNPHSVEQAQTDRCVSWRKTGLLAMIRCRDNQPRRNSQARRA